MSFRSTLRQLLKIIQSYPIFPAIDIDPITSNIIHEIRVIEQHTYPIIFIGVCLNYLSIRKDPTRKKGRIPNHHGKKREKE